MSGRSKNFDTLWMKLEAINSGYQAYFHNVPLERNPQKPNTELSYRWIQGWWQGKAAKESWSDEKVSN